MFFLRKKQPPEQREFYRRVLEEDDSMRVLLERFEHNELEASLLDLTMRGAGVRVPAPEGQAPKVSDVLEVTIQSQRDGWEIRTPGIVRQVKAQKGGAILCGIEFINLGNLYSQMDDTLALYFNRRSRVRVPAEADSPISADLASTGHRLTAVVYDLTTKGIGLLVRHAEATPLRVDAAAIVRLKLPDSKNDMEGRAFIRQHRALHYQDVVGLEFDLRQTEGFAAYQDQIAAFCARRLAERAKWEEPWCEEAA